MDLLLDLRQVASGDRDRSWQEAVRSNYLDLDIRFAGTAPAGTIVQSRVGAMTFGAIASAPQKHERSRARLSDEDDHLLAWMQFRGHSRWEQRGRNLDLRPGSFVIMDVGEEYSADLFEEHQGFAIRIPRLFFQGAFAAERDIVNVLVDRDEGSMLIVDFFRRMAREFEGLHPDQKVRMSEFGVRLMHEIVAAKLEPSMRSRDAGVEGPTLFTGPADRPRPSPQCLDGQPRLYRPASR